MLERIYIGYSFTPMGSIIGALWGFVDWGIAGAIFAWLYNWINKKIYKYLYVFQSICIKKIVTVILFNSVSILAHVKMSV